MRFWDPLQGESSIVHSDFFDINAPFTIEDSENGQIEIGDQWTNSRMQYNVFVNTQGDLNYMGQNIPQTQSNYLMANFTLLMISSK